MSASTWTEGGTSLLRCPVCGAPLALGARAAVCPSGHSFDRARQGYFHLLNRPQAAAKHRGDDRLMVLSRRAFLGAGHYEPLRRAVEALACRYAPPDCELLDVGCGEGYYTEGVYRALTAAGVRVSVTAVDISRDAVKQAAARPFPKTAAVASAFGLPVADGGADLLLSIFAPVAEAEFFRVLKPGGVLIRAVPRERHLLGLKEKIYDEPYLNPPVTQALPGFSPLELRPLDWQLHLDSPEEVDALFKMTPYYYKTSAEGQRRAAALTELSTPLSFALLADRRDAELPRQTPEKTDTEGSEYI